MNKKDSYEYGFNTGFFGDRYVSHRCHLDKENKWDDEWDIDRLSQILRETMLPEENYEGFVSNRGDVVTIHIKEDSNIPIDIIMERFGLDKKHGVEAVLVEKFKDWK